MPSGKVHDKITVVTAAASVPVWWLTATNKDPIALVVALAAYVFSGFWLSDDLDTNSVSYKRWGAFRWLWWPYQKAVKHRSWVSHGVGVGPIGRVLYFLIVLWAVTRAIMWLLIQAGVIVNRDALLGGLWRNSLSWTLAHPTWALWAVIGLILGGLTHSVADAVVSWAKRVW